MAGIFVIIQGVSEKGREFKTPARREKAKTEDGHSRKHDEARRSMLMGISKGE